MPQTVQEITESLSPLERKVVPHLKEDFENIVQKTELDEVSVLRALRFLENKGILKLTTQELQTIELGTNGIYYKKNHLPERRLLIALEEERHLLLAAAQKNAKLSDNEFKVSLGILKGKAFITLTDGKISLIADKQEVVKKTLEEQLIDLLPLDVAKLSPEQKYAFETLKKRKEIIEVKNKQVVSFTLTHIGKEIAGKKIDLDLLEEVTPELIKSWTRGKKFRSYDLSAPMPRMQGGKRHFVNQASAYARKIWTEMGFTEMEGSYTDTSFWVFDALFTPQDHPAREMQDTFFIKDVVGQLPHAAKVEAVQKAHEQGVHTSKGWKYAWSAQEAKKVVLRTHTTNLSARMLATLKESDIPAKYFAIGKVFRNESLDWIHGFEFYQTEGIVIDKNANFRHLLAYLQEFYKKMGFDSIRFRPGFFPYTEPSVEFEVYDIEKQRWIELGGAGIFRPEVVIPLLGKDIPVLAWGQGFDRIIKDAYAIKDLREMYANDIQELRNKPLWIK